MDHATSLVFNNVEVTDPDIRTCHKVKNRLRYLDHYYCGHASSTSCSTFFTPYPMHSFASCDNCSSDHNVFCRNIYVKAKSFVFKEVAQYDC